MRDTVVYAQDIDAVYFGDGMENDLEDWSSFLEVPDFMTTFANSQVRGIVHQSLHCVHCCFP